MTLLAVLGEISNSVSIHKCKWLNPWSNHNTVNLCSVFMIKLLQSSLRTKKSIVDSLFFQWFPFSLPLYYSQRLSLIFHRSHFLCFFKILHWLQLQQKVQSSTHNTYLLSSSLFLSLPPWWNLLCCNCQHEWWSVSVSVCLIAHLYTHTHFSTQTVTHKPSHITYVCSQNVQTLAPTGTYACAHTPLCEVAAGDNEWALHFLPHSLTGVSLLALHQARGHRIVRVRSISRNKPW